MCAEGAKANNLVPNSEKDLTFTGFNMYKERLRKGEIDRW